MEVWRAFKTQDANGNGNPNDEVPFGFNYDMIKLMMNVFGINSNGEFSVVDGEYVYDPEHPNYELFLDTMRQMYEEGPAASGFCNHGRVRTSIPWAPAIPWEA